MGVVMRRSGFGKGATYLWALPMLAKDDHACHSQSVAHMEDFGAHGADEPVADVQDSGIEHAQVSHGEGEL
jgi:hypothetical protein